MFEKSRKQLEKYYCLALENGLKQRGEHLLHEVRSRLRELQWIYDRLVTLDKELVNEAREKDKNNENSMIKLVYTDASRPNCETLDISRSPFKKQNELRILLEAFYYSAHRVQDIFKDGKVELPGINGFECFGVRNVRNHLVEHPSRKNGVIVFSFATGGPVGPQFKPLRWSLDPEGITDEGLWKNSNDFKNEIESRLSKAIEELRSNTYEAPSRQ